MNRTRFPTPPWPDHVDKLREGEQYEKTHPVTGITRTVTLIQVDTDGPGTVTQYTQGDG